MAPNKGGRPSLYTEELADDICRLIADGETLTNICKMPDMPPRMTVYDWLEAHEGFRAKYARARDIQADAMDDLILKTASETTNDSYRPDQVRIGAYQWRAARLKPRVYGQLKQDDKNEERELKIIIEGGLSDE